MSSIKVVSRDLKGTPLADIMKSKKETSPPLAAGLNGCTPSTRYPTLSESTTYISNKLILLITSHYYVKISIKIFLRSAFEDEFPIIQIGTVSKTYVIFNYSEIRQSHVY